MAPLWLHNLNSITSLYTHVKSFVLTHVFHHKVKQISKSLNIYFEDEEDSKSINNMKHDVPERENQ